jgi:transposase
VIEPTDYDPATSVSAVARRYGLHASQLFTWRQRLAALAACEGPGFVPVVVAEDAAATSPEPAGRIEIALGPAVVRVGPDVDAAALRRVLEAGWVLSRSANPQPLQGFAPRRRLWPGPTASSTSMNDAPSSA